MFIVDRPIVDVLEAERRDASSALGGRGPAEAERTTTAEEDGGPAEEEAMDEARERFDAAALGEPCTVPGEVGW